jgi:hypothetical protein
MPDHLKNNECSEMKCLAYFGSKMTDVRPAVQERDEAGMILCAGRHEMKIATFSRMRRTPLKRVAVAPLSSLD